MKQLYCLIVVIVFTATTSMGQAPSTSTPLVPTIAGSYFNTVPVDVYPFKKNQPSQTDAQQQIDRNIHFKLKKDTRFFVNSTVASNGTTLGYVITVWNFNDADGKKKKFYDSLINAKTQDAESLSSLKASAKEKKDAVAAMRSKTKADSLALVSLQADVATTQASFKATADKLIASGSRLTKSGITTPADTSRENVKAFFKAQAEFNAMAMLNNHQKQTDKLIENALQLPATNTGIAADITAYKSALSIKDNAKKDFDDKQALIVEGKRSLKVAEDELKGVQIKISAMEEQNSRTVTDGQEYKVLKRNAGEYADTNVNNESPYAVFDDLAYVDSWANGWQFFLNASDFTPQNCATIFPRGNSFTWGFLTLPLKLRFDNSKDGRFNFEQNLNFGLTFGKKHQFASKDDESINWLAGVSVVNVPLNNAQAKTATTDAVAATSTLGLSVSFGAMYQFNKFQIGAFIGRDFAGEHAYQFAYQGKP